MAQDGKHFSGAFLVPLDRSHLAASALLADRINRPLLLVRVDAAQEEETGEGSLDSL